MRVLSQRTLPRPVILAASDKLVMTYVEVEGVVRHERETTLGVVAPSRQITVDQAVLFEMEMEGRYIIGAVLVEVDYNVETARKSSETDGEGDPTEPTDGGASIGGVRRIGPAK